jgi:hypothetical protein
MNDGFGGQKSIKEVKKLDFRQHFDVPTLVVMAITLVLFGGALFVKGLTHDMLIEAGVFLISVKLIMMIVVVE